MSKQLSEMSIQELSALELKQHNIISRAGDERAQLLEQQILLAGQRSELENTEAGRFHKKERVKINKKIDDTINNMQHLLSENVKEFISKERAKREKGKSPKYSVAFLKQLHNAINAENENYTDKIKSAEKEIQHIQAEVQNKVEKASETSLAADKKARIEGEKKLRLNEIEAKKPYSLALRFWLWVRKVVVFFSRNPMNKAIAWADRQIDRVKDKVIIPDDLVSSGEETNPFVGFEDESSKSKESKEEESVDLNASEIENLSELLKEIDELADKSEKDDNLGPPWTRSEKDIPELKEKKKLKPKMHKAPEVINPENESESEVNVEHFSTEKKSTDDISISSDEEEESTQSSSEENEDAEVEIEFVDFGGESENDDVVIEVLSTEEESSEKEDKHKGDRESAKTLAKNKFSAIEKMTVEQLRKEAKKEAEKSSSEEAKKN